MEALLVLDSSKGNLRLMIRLSRKKDKEEVMRFLGESRYRDAFNVLKTKGQVAAFVPYGRALPKHPRITLIEDLL